MKLNVTPKELLALYNLLYEQQRQDRLKYEPGVDPVPDYVYLDQVFGRVRSLIVGSIGRLSDDPADAKKSRVEDVLAREQVKIDRLKVDLVDVDQERAKLFDAVAKRDKDFLVPDRDEDLVVPEYPTRPRRASGGHHGRKK